MSDSQQVEATLAVADVARMDGITFTADALRKMHDGLHYFWVEEQQALVWRGTLGELQAAGPMNVRIVPFPAARHANTSIGYLPN